MSFNPISIATNVAHTAINGANGAAKDMTAAWSSAVNTAKGNHPPAHQAAPTKAPASKPQGPSGPTSCAPSSATPAPVTPGTPDYYQQRYNDFVARNPCAKPPDYYLEYGQKYCDRFLSLTGRDLSPAGLAWRDRTLLALQQAIENKRASDPEGFAELERDPEAFRKFAFETHPAAYVNSGLYDLPAQDILVIALTPDINDVLSHEGIRQTLITLGKLKPGDVPDILRSTGQEYLSDNGLLAFTPLGPGMEIGTQLERMWDRVTEQSWMPSWVPWVVAPLPTLDNALPDFDLPWPFPKDIPLVPFL